MSLDPDYLDVLHAITDPFYFESRFTLNPAHATGKRKVSRGMLLHLPELEESRVVDTDGEKSVFMPMFTTPKKNGDLRLIFDCRRLNSMFEEPPRMDLPHITDVIDYIMDHELAGTSDGVSYFYQFPLHTDIQKYFSSRLGGFRGKYTDVSAKVMCMGWSWAPALAQRASNVLIKDCGVAWVDNFIVLGKDRGEYDEKRSIFLDRAREVNVALDDTTILPMKKFTALGIEFDLESKQYRMDPEWAQKASTKIMAILTQESATFQELYRIAGSLIWRAQVLRCQLCNLPHLLAQMGKIGRIASATGNWDEKFMFKENPELMKELTREVEQLRTNEWVRHVKVTSPTAEIWSDASDTHWSYLLFENTKLVYAERGETNCGEHIFYSELAAAIRGIARAQSMGHKSVLSNIDNQPAALALRKGLSTNFTANRWLGRISTMERRVMWVPTHEMIADPYTRPDPHSGILVPLPTTGVSVQELKDELKHNRANLFPDDFQAYNKLFNHQRSLNITEHRAEN